MNIKELYQEIILEHGKNPRNLRKTDNFNKDAKGYNPLCGDHVHIYLKLNEKKKVEDASFEGSGCAISMASASIMTDLVKGKEENEVKEIINDFLGMIKVNPELMLNSSNKLSLAVRTITTTIILTSTEVAVAEEITNVTNRVKVERLINE